MFFSLLQVFYIISYVSYTYQQAEIIARLQSLFLLLAKVKLLEILLEQLIGEDIGRETGFWHGEIFIASRAEDFARRRRQAQTFRFL